MIRYDPRWTGPHGIGRFAAEVLPRLEDAEPLDPGVARLSILDPVATTLAVGRLAAGVYFTPGFNPPLRAPVPFVFCVYDLIHLRFPQESTWLRRAYYASVVRPAAQRAYRILTISQHSRDTILEWTGLAPGRVQVAGCGVADAFVPEGHGHAPGFPYFLYVGRREPHKNVGRLLQAFAASRSRRDLRLVFTGEPDAASAGLIRRLDLEDAVVFAGVLDDAGLARWYRGATALLLPSLYEGFGLPIAEAMACGTPVLTSAVTAIPETAGEDNALMVEPLSVEAIAAGIDRLADDPALRNRLRQRGLAHVARFSWRAVAGRVAAVLREAGG